jgi:hypothetical protein
MMASDLVVLRRYPARIHAELAKSALQAVGIDCSVVGGDFSYRTEMPGSTIDLIVKAEDARRALEILGPEERFSN